MATNLSALNGVISDLFGVIGTIITNMVDLLTGDLLVLAIVGAFVGLIIGIIALLLAYMRNTMSSAVGKTKMK